MAKQSSDRYTIDALAKGLRVLSYFSEQHPALRMSEMVELSGIPMPTLFRIVKTLENEGYLERFADGTFRPDAKVLTLGFAAVQSLDLVQTSSGPLRQLAENTGETVNLGVLSDDRVLYLVRLRNSEIVTANIQVGSTLPAVYASMGKVLLAYLDDEVFANRITSASFDGGGPNAVRSITALQEQLVLVRERGYAIQDQEIAFGLRSIAAPVRDATGAIVAAVNVAVHSSEYDIERLLNELRDPLLEAAASISLRLGFRASVGAIR
jgi:IclR family pca regulon transcriptional regulator